MHDESLKVLLVEDAPAYVILLKQLLQSPGLSIETASNLESGLKIAKAKNPDVILLDLGLPDCQGLETFEVFRDHCPHIPVVIISGLDDEDIAARAVKAGAQDYLVKGIYLTKGEAGQALLLRAIRYASERHHIQVELRKERDLLETRVSERTKELQEVNLKLRWYYERLNTLREIDYATLEAKSPEQMASIALKHFGRLVPHSYADMLIFSQNQLPVSSRLNPKSEQVVVIAKRTYGQAQRTGELFVSSDLMINQKLRRGEHYLIDNLDQLLSLTPFEKRLYEHGVRSYLAVPLIAEGKLIGVINLGQDRPYAFTEEYIKSAHQIAMPLALMLRNAQLFEQIRAGQVHLQELTKRLVSAQEEERQRISLELHDDSGQAMTALKIKLSLMQKNLPQECENLKSQLDEAIALTSGTMESIRSLAHDLRPPALDAVGFNQAVKDLCQRITHQTGMLIDYRGTDLQDLPAHYEISLYRVLQESLNNAIKHAQASYVTIRLSTKDDMLILKVTDNGIGFDPQKLLPRIHTTGLGLKSITERIEALGGTFELSSQPGQGTSLLVRVPWRPAE